jgi:NAD(P)-dependent dehydrogenase (short-subunit alcohol dehydrogenase family)
MFELHCLGDRHTTTQMIQRRGGTAIGIDVCHWWRTPTRLIERTLVHFGRLDVVVNNAGIDCESPVLNLDVDLLAAVWR